MADPEEGQEAPVEVPPEAPAPPQNWEATLDARLAARDQALAEMFNQTITNVMDRMQQQQPQPPQRQEQPEEELTDQDFANSPTAALNKFHRKKIQPILDRVAQQPQQIPVETAAGMMAMIEINKQNLKASMTPEEWNTYAPYFERSIQKANPNAMLNADQMRMAYVIVKDHVDRSGVLQSAGEQQRITRNTAAGLSPAGGRQAKAAVAKVEFDEEERRVIAGMGIAPEVYMQNSDPKAEFELGGGSKGKS